MSFIHEKAQIHTLNKSTEIFDPVKSKRRYKFIIQCTYYLKDGTIKMIIH